MYFAVSCDDISPLLNVKGDCGNGDKDPYTNHEEAKAAKAEENKAKKAAAAAAKKRKKEEQENWVNLICPVTQTPEGSSKQKKAGVVLNAQMSALKECHPFSLFNLQTGGCALPDEGEEPSNNGDALPDDEWETSNSQSKMNAEHEDGDALPDDEEETSDSESETDVEREVKKPRKRRQKGEGGKRGKGKRGRSPGAGSEGEKPARGITVFCENGQTLVAMHTAPDQPVASQSVARMVKKKGEGLEPLDQACVWHTGEEGEDEEEEGTKGKKAKRGRGGEKGPSTRRKKPPSEPEADMFMDPIRCVRAACVWGRRGILCVIGQRGVSPQVYEHVPLATGSCLCWAESTPMLNCALARLHDEAYLCTLIVCQFHVGVGYKCAPVISGQSN
eukprot:1156958-Pelagomonas_calceolata.AAC.5